MPLGHPLFGQIYPCPRCNQAAIEAECGLKTHERAITLEDLILADRPGAARMRKAAERFIAAPAGYLSLHGGNGNGKTIVAMAIVNACIGRGVLAQYVTASELMAWLREAFDESVLDTDTGRIRRLARVPVLVIDELDKMRDTPYAREMQQELINMRYREADTLGTVLIWNGGLFALPWPAVVSRLREFVVIENQDDDLRPSIGAAKGS